MSSLANPPSTFPPDIDYRHFDSANIEPRYEFGYGLSYTIFTYSSLSIKTLLDLRNPPVGELQPGGKSGLWADAVSATFTVKNTGAYAGNEVAQLYLVRHCFFYKEKLELI
jgi:beta-glucosidase